MSELGQLVKRRRKAANLSQKKLGEACGLSDSEIMRIENGTRKTPSWRNLCNIAQVLKIRPLDILLEANYISKDDIYPCPIFKNTDRLTETERVMIQLLIDFIVEKDVTIVPERGRQKCHTD